MTRIVRFHELGGPEVLRFEEDAPRDPASGEVRVRMQALGLNRAELLFMQGQYLVQPKLPSGIGAEGVGVVDALGPGVTDWNVGDSVCIAPNFDFAATGLAGEMAIAPVSALVRRPRGLSDEEAAAIWMAYGTAYGGLVEWGGLRSGQGQTAVITAASSSVGFAAIQIAKMLGAQAIATTRTSAKKAALQAAGADLVVAMEEENLVQAVKDATQGVGADVVFDAVAGPFMETAAKIVKNHGFIVPYGILSMQPTPYPLFLAMPKGFSIRAFHVVWHLMQDAKRWERAKALISEGLGAGKLKPVIDRTFPFDKIADAYRHLASGEQLGKVVVTLS